MYKVIAFDLIFKEAELAFKYDEGFIDYILQKNRDRLIQPWNFNDKLIKFYIEYRRLIYD